MTPLLEYDSPVWQVENCEPVEKNSKEGLVLGVGVLGTGILPLDLRREELSIRQTTRIMMKDNN